MTKLKNVQILMDYFNEIRDGIWRKWLKIGKSMTKLEKTLI
jgi:hypothetical protein